MDGKGRYLDNIFVERLWRCIKYDKVYLKAYQTVAEERKGGSTCLPGVLQPAEASPGSRLPVGLQHRCTNIASEERGACS